MNALVTLKSLVEVANIHAKRMKTAFTHLQPILPLTLQKLETLTDEDLGFLELLTSRFAKLQDLFGAKIFPLMLELLQESTVNMSALDRLHKLEKLGIIASSNDWILMRNVRNMVTHEYPEDFRVMLNNLTQIITQAQLLLAYWEGLYPQLIALMDKKS